MHPACFFKDCLMVNYHISARLFYATNPAQIINTGKQRIQGV
jgi:hypothetical protein